MTVPAARADRHRDVESSKPWFSASTFVVAVSLVGVAVAVVRAFPRISVPSLWAEDGFAFLVGAREHGLASLYSPYAGCLHVVPRLMALAMAPFPLTWQPGMYAVAATVVSVAMFSIALSGRLAWLLPTLWQRALVFLALVVAPARFEVTGNLANLIFLGSIALLLISLAGDPRTVAGRWAEAGGVGLLALSGLQGIVTIPLFAARLRRERSRHSLLLLLFVTVASIVQWSVLFLSSDRTQALTGSTTVVGRFASHRLFISWLVGESKLASASQHHAGLLDLAFVAVVVAFVVALVVLPDRVTAFAIALAFVGAMLLPAMSYRRMWMPYIAQRHLALPLAILTIVFVAALGRPVLSARIVASTILVVALIGVVVDFRVKRWPEQPLGPTAACLKEHHAPCLLPLNPPGWPHKAFLTK